MKKPCTHDHWICVPGSTANKDNTGGKPDHPFLLCANPRCGFWQPAAATAELGQLFANIERPAIFKQIHFFVAGVPAPQGSKHAFVIKGPKPRAVIVENSKAVRPWRNSVSSAAREAAATAGWERIGESAAGVHIVFWMPAPATFKRILPCVTPDIDKLVRSTYDGLIEAGNIMADDSRITDQHTLERYAMPGMQPGANITITRLED